MRIEKLWGQRIYLDSNALIYAIETDAATQPAAVRSLLQAVSSSEVRAFVSPIVRAEVLVQPLRSGNDRLAEIYRTMLARPGADRHNFSGRRRRGPVRRTAGEAPRVEACRCASSSCGAFRGLPHLHHGG